MKKKLSLLSLTLPILLAACGTTTPPVTPPVKPPVTPAAGRDFGGVVKLSLTDNPSGTPYKDSDAVGRGLGLIDLQSSQPLSTGSGLSAQALAQAINVNPAAYTVVNADLKFRITLPETAATSSKINIVEIPCSGGTGTINYSDPAAMIGIYTPVLQIQEQQFAVLSVNGGISNTADAAGPIVTRQSGELIYSDRAVNVSGTRSCPGDSAASYDVKLHKGWNTINVQSVQRGGPASSNASLRLNFTSSPTQENVTLIFSDQI